MTLLKKVGKPTNYSPRARLLRSGSIPAPQDLNGEGMRSVAIRLRDALDRIDGDPDASPRERAADARRAIQEARTASAQWRAKSEAVLAEVDATARKIASAVSDYERSLTPLAMRRIERVAEQFAALTVEQRKAKLEAAVGRHDSETLAALSLVDVNATRPRLGLAALHAPKELDQFIGAAKNAIHLRACSMTLDAALGELEQLGDTAYSAAHGAKPEDHFGAANGGLAFMGIDIMASIVPSTWPAELVGIAVPVASTTNTAPAPGAGGAA